MFPASSLEHYHLIIQYCGIAQVKMQLKKYIFDRFSTTNVYQINLKIEIALYLIKGKLAKFQSKISYTLLKCFAIQKNNGDIRVEISFTVIFY